MQHLELLLLCDKHMRLRGDLYARGAIENCLLRDAALMSSLHVSQKPLGGEGQAGDWRFVLCHRHDCDQARSAVQSPSVSQRPIQSGRDVALCTHCSMQQGVGMKCKWVWVGRRVYEWD